MNHSNICSCLRSDKVTWRVRGRDGLKEATARDRIQVRFSNHQWWEITKALLEYETKELSYSRSKNKEYKHENAVFFKTIVRQSLQHSLLSAKKVLGVVTHILHVVHDQSLDESYHREYVECLCDLLEMPKVNRYTQGPGVLAALFNFLRLSYQPAAPSPLLLRLLKGLCRVVYLQSASECGILGELLEWMASTLAAAREALSPSSSHMLSVVCAHSSCYSSVMELCGSNCLGEVCSHVGSLLDAVVQQLPLQTVSNRDPMLQFLLQFFSLSAGATLSHTRLQDLEARSGSARGARAGCNFSPFSLPPRHPLCFRPHRLSSHVPAPGVSAATPVLVLLYESLVDLELGQFLVSLMQHARGLGAGSVAGGTGKGSSIAAGVVGDALSFINLMDDARFALNMRVVAWTLCLLQGQEQLLPSLQSESSQSSSQTLTQINLGIILEQKKHPLTALYMSILSLNGNLGGARCGHDNNEVSCPPFTQTQAMTQLTAQAGGGLARGPGHGGRHARSVLLLESKVYLLVALCEVDMEGGAALLPLAADVPVAADSHARGVELTATSVQEAKLNNLSKWLLLMRQLLFRLTSASRSLRAGEGQLVGVVLHALHTLLILSRTLLLQSRGSSATSLTRAIGDALRENWAETLRQLAAPSSSRSSLSLSTLLFTTCRRHSAAAALMQLFISALSPHDCSSGSLAVAVEDCLVLPSTWHILQQQVWQALTPLYLSYDPRDMDCPQFYLLVAALQRSTSSSTRESFSIASSESATGVAGLTCNITLLSKPYLSHLEQNTPNSVVLGLYNRWLSAPCSESFQPSSSKTTLGGSEGVLLVVAWLDSLFTSQLAASGCNSGGGGGGGSSRLYVLQNLDIWVTALTAVTRGAYMYFQDYYRAPLAIEIPSYDDITGSGRINFLDKCMLKRLVSYQLLGAHAQCSSGTRTSKSLSDEISTLPTAHLSSSVVKDYIHSSSVINQLCDLLLLEIQGSKDTAGENTNEFLSQRQLSLLLLSAMLLAVMQQVPNREELQLTYSRSSERDKHKELLCQLRDVIEKTYAMFWTSQEALFEILVMKPCLFRGNGNVSIAGCALYHSKCKELCSAAFTEGQRLRLILHDLSRVGVESKGYSSTRSNSSLNKRSREQDSEQDSKQDLRSELSHGEAASSCAAEVLRYVSLMMRESLMASGAPAPAVGASAAATKQSHLFKQSSSARVTERGSGSRQGGSGKVSTPPNTNRNTSASASVSFDDDDDDFMEKASSTSTQRSLSASALSELSSQLEMGPFEDEGGAGGGGACRLSFTRDQVQMLSASICCFLAASMASLSLDDSEGEHLPVAAACTAAVSQVMRVLTSSAPVDDDGKQSPEVTQSYKLSSEVALTLAEHMTTLAYPSPAIHAFMVQNTWAEDWGVLGYFRVLSVIRSLTAQPDYFVPSQRSASAVVQHEYNQIFRLVFCAATAQQEDEEDEDEESDDDSRVHVGREIMAQLPSFLKDYWGNRVLQLECGANIFMAAPQMNKRNFGDIIAHGLIDSDKRVNQAAVAHLPLLFAHLPSHHKIYQYVRSFIGLDDAICEAASDYDDCEVSDANLSLLDDVQRKVHARKMLKWERLQEEVANKMHAVAACGLASPSLLDEALKDIFLLQAAVSSEIRASDLSSSSWSNGDRASPRSTEIEGMRGNRATLKSHRHVHFIPLVEAHLASLASHHSYHSVLMMLRDHLHFLLTEWLTVICLKVEVEHEEEEVQEAEYQERKLFLPLSAFPFHLLGYDSLKTFLLDERDTLIPLICQLQPSQHRWAQLRLYTHGAGFVANGCSEDHAIARTIRDNYATIRGVQLCLSHYFFSCASIIGDQSSLSSTRPLGHDDEAEHMAQLVNRVTNAGDIEQHLLGHGEHIGQVVEYILCCGCAWEKLTDVVSSGSMGFWESLVRQSRQQQAATDGVQNSQNSVIMTLYARFTKDLSAVLDKTVALFKRKNKTDLFLSIDILSTVARLKLLLQTSQSEYKKTCYVFAIHFLSKYVSSKMFLDNIQLTSSARSSSSSSTGGGFKRQHSVELSTRAMLNALVVTVEEAPVLFEVGVHSLQRMVDTISVVIALPGGVQASAESQRQIKLAQRLASCLPDIYADVVCVLCALNIALVRSFVSSTRTPPGTLSAPSGTHSKALDAAAVLHDCFRPDSFIAVKYRALMQFTEQQATSSPHFVPTFVAQSQYVGHSRACLISSFSCKALRHVLSTAISCGDLLRMDPVLNAGGLASHPAVLTPLARETARLLFLDWECLHAQYTDMATGDLESCSLIEELQGRVQASFAAPLAKDSYEKIVRMQSVVGSVWQFLQGKLVPRSLLWLKLVNLRECLKPQCGDQAIATTLSSSIASKTKAEMEDCDTAGGRILCEVEEDFVSRSVTCVTALLALGRVEGGAGVGRHRRADEMRCLEHDSAYVMGSLGVQDTHSVKHNGLSLSTRIQEIDRGFTMDGNYSWNIHGQLACHGIFLKLDLITSKLFFSLFEADETVAQEALCAVRQLQSSGALIDLLNDSATIGPSSVSPKGYSLRTMAQSSSSVRLTLAVLESVAATAGDLAHTGYAPDPCRGAVQGGGAWSHEVWCTIGKIYSTWVTTLVSCLIRDCYGATSTSLTFGRDTKWAEANLSRRVRGSAKESLFMLSLEGMAAIHVEVAEALFPLLLLDVLQSSDKDTSRLVADRLEVHLFNADASAFQGEALITLSGQTPLQAATRLGCQALVFLLRQNILLVRSGSTKALNTSSSKTNKKRPLDTQRATREPPGDGDGSPYSFGIPIDFSVAATAAVRCGLICTASLFVELAAEVSYFYWQRDQDESEPPAEQCVNLDSEPLHKRQVLLTAAAGMAAGGMGGTRGTSQARHGSNGSDISKRFALLPMELLRDLYHRLHDPDASLGVPASMNYSLGAQAKQYAHAGQWQAALGTYQCILQLPQSVGAYSTGMGVAEAHVGVAESLRALGYQHLLQQHVSSMHGRTHFDGGVRGGAMLCGGGDGDDVMNAVSGEAVWRQLLSTNSSMENLSDFASSPSGSNGMSHAATEAMTNLMRWPQYLESSVAESRPALLTGDYFHSALCASIRAIRSDQHGSVMNRLSECTRLMLPALVEEGQKEGRRGLMLQLMRFQQLVEVQEVAACLGGIEQKRIYTNYDHLPHQRQLAQVLTTWRERLENGSALNDAVCCENLLSLRLALLITRPALSSSPSRPSFHSSSPSTDSGSGSGSGSGHRSERHMFQFLRQVMDVAGGGGGDQGVGHHESHATLLVSPLLYKVRALLFGNVSAQWDSKQEVTATAEFALFESRLLWRKDLHEVAVTSLQDHVIEPLTNLLAEQATVQHTSKSASAPLLPGDVTRARNLLSEAYRTTGEWVAARRSRSGLTVLQQYLEPAVTFARNREQQVKTHLTLAQYHLHMHQIVRARVESLEWKQGKKLSEERKEEFEQCMQALMDMKKAYNSLPGSSATKSSSSKTSKHKNPPAMTEEQAALYMKMRLANRHLGMLKGESAIDAKEREDVERSVEVHLVQALDHFRTVLVLSPSASVDTVFHVIHLWFNSAQVPQVNEIVQDIIHRAPSFHFVSLHYQIMSRLDGSASEGHLRLPPSRESASAGSVLKRAKSVVMFSQSGGSVGSQVSFQNTLTDMLFKLGKEHPYHILPQLFALMHDKLVWENLDTYGAVIDAGGQAMSQGDAQVAGGRIVAARSILHAVKHHFHSQTQAPHSFSGAHPYAHLVEGMEILFVQYVKLALTNVDAFIQAKKTKHIRFGELVVRGEKSFHDCLNGLQIRRPGASAEASCASETSKKAKQGSKDAISVKTLHTADFHIAVVTKHHRVLPDGRYFPSLPSVSSSSSGCSAFESSGMTFVHGFTPEFSLTEDGLSRPKIINCLGSDGRSYTQLVKGGDDTRQDSVMEQVFGHVNMMLRSDKACLQRRLNIRTYKIVPTTPQSGIIEWVENTMAFGSYLCERSSDPALGAHSRYHPLDLKASECRGLMNEAKDKGSEEKERTFLAICRQFRPAFRYFFLEAFSDPSDWMEARIAYTRGVAAASMVGYILGIGDRHAQNILIDTATAEVVHIDFGIMFEQGKVIGTPETVPFRLTRDVVDGMGVTGVEGTFRKCCEEVLRVLRLNLSQLLTILEVVIHDPLYKWSLSPVQAQARRQQQNQQPGALGAGGDYFLAQLKGEGQLAGQAPRHTAGGGSGSSSQDAAQRALLRIQNKLLGYEDPSGQSMSVAGQVQHVISEAQDPKNLCKLFTGWSQWV